MATISKVQIANMALSHVGERNVIEIFGEKTTNGGLADTWYDFSREAVLKAYDWSFARQRIALALDKAEAPDGIWTFRYLYPTECISIRRLVSSTSWPAGEGRKVPFTIELNTLKQKTVLTDLEFAVARYTGNIIETSLFSPMFVLALARLLAHHMAMSITGKMAIADRQLQIFNSLLVSGAGIDAQEGGDKDPPDADHIIERDAQSLLDRRC